ncbi:hypothetical protein TNCV_4677361 [Trichonephila clavipes]|nr:hypothetical protein TNCV_4677361 [Trichonephila clavipes]
MFRSGGQPATKTRCLVLKKAWYSFNDPLKGWTVESTLPSLGFEPQTCGVKLRTPNGRQCVLARFHPSFEREHPGGGQRPPTNLTSGLAARRLF